MEDLNKNMKDLNKNVRMLLIRYIISTRPYILPSTTSPPTTSVKIIKENGDVLNGIDLSGIKFNEFGDYKNIIFSPDEINIIFDQIKFVVYKNDNRVLQFTTFERDLRDLINKSIPAGDMVMDPSTESGGRKRRPKKSKKSRRSKKYKKYKKSRKF